MYASAHGITEMKAIVLSAYVMLQGSGGVAPQGQSGMTREQKVKLLWGAKKEAVTVGVVPASGANRWDVAQFTTETDKEKFQRLMGVKEGQTSEQQGTIADEFAHKALTGMYDHTAVWRSQQVCQTTCCFLVIARTHGSSIEVSGACTTTVTSAECHCADCCLG